MNPSCIPRLRDMLNRHQARGRFRRKHSPSVWDWTPRQPTKAAFDPGGNLSLRAGATVHYIGTVRARVWNNRSHSVTNGLKRGPIPCLAL